MRSARNFIRGLLSATTLVMALPPCGRATPIYEVAGTVDNSAGASLSPHQVRLSLDTAALIAAGKLQASGADLRFTDTSGTPLCHFLEGPLDNANTIVWLKLPAIPAAGSVPLFAYYGDPGAVSADDPACTFESWEGFDTNSGIWSVACGDLIWSINGGFMSLNWSTKGIFLRSPSIALTPQLVAEAKITAATGRWPGLHWFKAGTQYSYALTFGSSSTRISTTPATVNDGDLCTSHNWASTVAPIADAAGLWSLAWPSTGTQEAAFPGVGALTATSMEHQRDTPLQLAFGGIATGAGAMTVDWLRTRRYATPEPTTTLGSEHEACGLTPALCNDTDACTTDACHFGAGCSHTPLTCNDASVCTIDTCDTGTGCVYTAISCDDANACTVDGCNATSGCHHSPSVCDDGDACTLDTCDALTGCAHAAITCDDQTVCTSDSCNAITGCAFTPISCDDQDACTTESCDALTGCAHATVTCDDHSVCTTDGCATLTGCTFDAIDCNDQDACFDDTCDALTGCGHTAVSCDDGNACTSDSCDATTGCAHVAIACSDDTACTVDTCDPTSGCVYAPLDCDDDDACNVDLCDAGAGCHHVRLSCDDDDPCTTDTCTPADGCAHTATVCEDHDRCTEDVCVSMTGCIFAPISCGDRDVCTTDRCEATQGCLHEPTHGPSFASLGCQLDGLREGVRAARSAPAIDHWFGRRIEKARTRFQRAQIAATGGARAEAARHLRAARLLLRQFFKRAVGLGATGRLPEPAARGLAGQARTATLDVQTLLKQL